jgi:predicted ATPase
MSYFAGDFAQARSHCEQALAICDPQHEDEARERYGEYTGTLATAFLANASWQLGEVDRARELMETANRRAADLGHAPSMANPLFTKSFLEIQRGDAAAALSWAEALEVLAREHGLTLQRTWAKLIAAWAGGRLGDPAGGAARLLHGLASLAEHGQRLDVPVYSALLAELEAEAFSAESALARIDEGLALAKQIEQRCHLAFMHRIRGEILLRRDPTNPVPAEEAFQAAIGIAREQGARSFGLQAALALARLYQSTARPAEAHAILAPALEGFSPTPEMPEIAEAQELLAALAETDEVKNAAAARQRQLQLQTRYGQAIMYARGFASDESKTAFGRARALAAGVGDASEQYDAYYGLYVSSVMRGDLNLAREAAEGFLREAENERRMTEAAAARRCVGSARFWQGDFIDARTNLAEALRTYVPERDRDAQFRFGADAAAAAAGFLALASWATGDVERARALSEEALARADETAHAPTRALVYNSVSLYQVLCGDPKNVGRTAKILIDLAREHGMALYLALGNVHSNWARARLGERESGMMGLKDALAAYLGQGNKLAAPLFKGLLAELEAEGNDADGALRRIDESLALTSETGERWTDALLHRIRGAILLRRAPANPAPAEEAFQAAIAIAQAQKARTFELRAALSLAKLYQSTGRLAEAHAVLAPALEGFSPTPEMPEIAEAQSLLGQLSSPSAA